jgi:hypothetical protein
MSSMTIKLSAAARWSALLLLSAPTTGLTDTLSDLRTDLDALKSAYDQRIQELEQRIALLEANPGVEPATPLVANPAPATTGGANAFNPAVSLIIAGTYSQLSRDPAGFRTAGFIPSGDELGPGARGFNLGESELTIAANVDPFFYGNVTAAVSAANTISIEEAYFRTTALAHGLTIKGGRYFSGVGYLNEVHAHAWDFVDQPLAYQALLGNQYAQDGLQLKWLAPTDRFVEFGLEGGSGQHFPATTRATNGLNSTAAFVHLGGDVGNSASWRSGLAWLHTSAVGRAYDAADGADVPVIDAFNGSSQTWVADFTWKWAPHGNTTNHQLKIQGEYLRRSENGSLTFDVEQRALPLDYRSRQSGWYLQSVYQFLPRWRAGLRYDALDSGRAPGGLLAAGVPASFAFPDLQSASPSRASLMLDWNPSEFSRLRTQYAWDNSRAGSSDRQLYLQYLFSLGAHGAHKY